ncbi:uncharacterized protein G2W53_042088 [Senna tora]|uniref:Uncharacterized protein n=1 Tax=Senna tora TaxID=362788 RepID=A0A834SGE0_9FABA|nr:uncharacterized protein G2W53_042088 [Senna tora]
MAGIRKRIDVGEGQTSRAYIVKKIRFHIVR